MTADIGLGCEVDVIRFGAVGILALADIEG